MGNQLTVYIDMIYRFFPPTMRIILSLNQSQSKCRYTLCSLITKMYDVIFSFGGVEVSEASDMVSDAGVAYDVEQCSCGTGYTGLSCEV